MSYLRHHPVPGGRRERRLQNSGRSRTSLQLGASAAIVAFAAGALVSAGAGSLAGATSDGSLVEEQPVAAVSAGDYDVEVLVESDEVTLEPKTKETEDPYALAGSTTVVTKGKPGKAIVNWDITYLDGIEVARRESITVVLEPATDEVIAIGTLVVPPTTEAERGSNRALGKEMAADLYGWTGDEWACLDGLWKKESNWRHTAENKSSGAYGIPQSLPGDKMKSSGKDWRTNPATQIHWGLGYIDNRYGSPCGAWAHSQSVGWY